MKTRNSKTHANQDDKDLANKLSHLYFSIKARDKKRVGISWKQKDFWSSTAFKLWYKKQPKQCAYCGIKKEELDKISELVKHGKIINKRSKTRGNSFEVDRKNDKIGYTAKNCCLACYWCNNAKTDTFSKKEFKLIGEAIGNALKRKIKK